MGFPKLLIEGKLEELQTNMQKKLNCVNRKLNIAITRIANAYKHPNILAEFIAGQLKNRVSFRKAMKKAIELTEQAGTKGVQVQIAGRIDGKEIARIEWIREGRVPLQTIRAKIDYCSYTVRTIYGALEPAWITSRQIEAGRRAMSRNVRRGGQIWVRIFPDKPVTVRPTETRMGSGKGSPEYWVSVVKPGKILYEMADNSGARELMCIRILGASNRRYAYIGDIVVAVIKEAVPNMTLERSEVIRAVIVRTCKELKRSNGILIQYDDNAAVVIDQEGNPKGTRIFCAIARELRQLNFTKIVSLAPEVL
ncbi:uncharacterized protein LOC113864381 [Abrus precatorius]|uniref:Large ribosomal subunit protein uL14c n=2 Tax=Abrus precatorius TaxID=3816 RepID=A0A8B8JP55_ABRPR|nr:uncharacterized protein LOC113847944 [Abrus precatorius]XP_027333235.1 uncharacterized protein LOC113848035 [Abrus precatorius]XP_027333353.1 uncharacterized protein LOC113848124 [Abrus precatorius]XP_027339261.1 uncharacterized protein LOC113853026 [Abrus precatorius]XP_027339518.1 uncharacterized protein LOC113853217 [Abrus precatorius]XP_027339530.1 uncharacterized protein LOC113853225 [Abrus precatorius]XP_027345342.1 uncharacterized protein LOC113857540 [Abrus precatorius]XP_02734574